MINKLKALYLKLKANDVIERVFHAAWQTGLAYFVTGILAKGDIRAVATLAVSAALSAGKTTAVRVLKARADAAMEEG